MKYSRQRELILAAVQEHPSHPTADMVYTLLKQAHPALSLATVYRNLNQLVEHGVLRRIGMPGASDRFDCRLDPHFHMLCSCCGEVFDAPVGLLSVMDRRIEEETGFTVTGHQLLLHGVCKNCHPAV